MRRKFEISSKYRPSGDQPKAINELVEGVNAGYDTQTLLGITGSGKTFTIANVIEQVQKPTLIIAHNKTLAAQLYNEFKELFPDNAVEYFISYYDYYQPEAYIPRTDTYIEKSASINEEIDRLRHNTTRSLYERNDVIVIASVSCIYANAEESGDKAGLIAGYVSSRNGGSQIKNCKAYDSTVDADRDAGQLIGGMAAATIQSGNTATRVSVKWNESGKNITAKTNTNIKNEIVGRVA